MMQMRPISSPQFPVSVFARYPTLVGPCSILFWHWSVDWGEKTVANGVVAGHFAINFFVYNPRHPNTPWARCFGYVLGVQVPSKRRWPWMSRVNDVNGSSNHHHLGVSKNRGTPKSSILIRLSTINQPFWGTPIFGNTQLKHHGAMFFFIS